MVGALLVPSLLMLPRAHKRASGRPNRSWPLFLLLTCFYALALGIATPPKASARNFILVFDGYDTGDPNGGLDDLVNVLSPLLTEPDDELLHTGWDEIPGALAYLAGKSPTPSDKVVVVGYSVGGDAARKFVIETDHAASLVLIDPVDYQIAVPDTIDRSLQGLLELLLGFPEFLQKIDQSSLAPKSEPGSAIDTFALIQEGDDVNGYSIQGKTVVCESCEHRTIDNDPIILSAIRDFVAAALGVTLPAPDCLVLGEGSPCEDGDGVPCTQGVCSGGSCVSDGPDHAFCNSGGDAGNDPDDDCTWNLCDGANPGADALGCVADAGIEGVGSPCSDGFTCTTDTCVVSGAPPFRRCEGTTPNHDACNSAPQTNDPEDDCVWHRCNPSDPNADVTSGCVADTAGEELVLRPQPDDD